MTQVLAPDIYIELTGTVAHDVTVPVTMHVGDKLAIYA
jgi:hypothetical protein